MSDLYNENDPLQDDANNGQNNGSMPDDGEEYRRPPYMRENDAYDPSAYDDENRYRTRVSGDGGKKKGGKKVAAAVVIAALAIGGTVGAVCWGLGNKVGNSAAQVNRGAVIETAAPEALVQEKLSSQAAEQEAAAAQQAKAEETEERTVPAAPAGAGNANKGPEGNGQGVTSMGAQETVSETMLAGAAETMAALTTSETKTEEVAETTVEEAETTGEADATEAAEAGVTEEEAAPAEAADADYETEAETADTEETQEAEAADDAEAEEPETQIGTAELDTTKATAVKALDVTEVVEVAMPSVVAITTTAVYESYNNNNFDPFYYFFYGYGGYGDQGGSNQYRVTGAGSGIIIGDDGTELWIVTNNHVVEGADTLTVNFVDDSSVDGYVMGTDARNDLALVGVKLANLSDETKQAIKAVKMGDSDSLKLGETVIAIGNALGLGQSVSTGVVSAVNREITTSEGTKLTTIQTDAAINPGNSGGALLDASGELIGINVAKDAETEVEGMGYAIPISSAKAIIERLTTMSGREPVSEEDYPFIGVQLQDISKDVASVYRMPEGILVYGLEEDGPARKAGMLEQDIIVGFNGIPVTTYEELTNELQYYAGGTEVTVTVQRLENGAYQEKVLNMTLGFRKDYQTTAAAQQQAEEPQENQDNSQQQPGQRPGQPGNSNGNGGWGGFNFSN